MRRRILASIALTYGVWVIVYALTHGALNGGTTGAKVGEASAFLIAGAIVFYSARSLIRAINERHHDAPRK